MYNPKINVCLDITLHYFIVCVQHKQYWDDNEREEEIVEITFYVIQNCWCYYYSFCEWTDANTLVPLG